MTRELPGQPLRQVAALPYRRSSKELDVLLITSRRTQKFILPKGWPSKKQSDRKSAAREAWEEAGVAGNVSKSPLAQYVYHKLVDDQYRPIVVDVFTLNVVFQSEEWQDKGRRLAKWLKAKDAQQLVDDPELAKIIKRFVKSQRI